MRRMIMCSLVLFLGLATTSTAAVFNWGAGSALPGVTSDWIVRLYEDTAKDGFIAGGLIGADDLWIDGYETTIIDLGGGILYYDNSTIGWPSGALGVNDSVFTVIFNSAVLASADQYVIVDSATHIMPAAVGPADYYLSSIANSWQAVPEPTTLALFGIGMGTAALARKRKRRKKNRTNAR